MKGQINNKPLIGMEAAELREVATQLGSAACADALTKQGMNGEALTALLEKDRDRAADILVELLPSSASIGERLIFTRRIQEQFKDEVRPSSATPEPADPGFVRRRMASGLLPVLLLLYLAWELGSIMAGQASEQPSGDCEEGDYESIGHMYAWLGWGPEPGSPCYESMQTHFSGAMPSRAVVERVKESLSPFEMTTMNTIFAEATCSDEINHEPGRLGSLFTDAYGSVFPMGGIGGFPFGGAAALNAFSTHVPDGGHMFILYGPHVGVTEDGVVGMVHRHGQKKPTTACGALMGMYNNCKKGLTTANYSEMDTQAAFCHEALSARLDEIENSPEPAAMLPKVAFDVANEQMQSMVKNLNLGTGYVVLLGGIQINTLDFREDQFLPMHFSIRSKSGYQDLTKGFDTRELAKFIKEKFGPGAEKGKW